VLLERLVSYAKVATDATSSARYMLEQTGLVATLMQDGSDEAIGRAENLKELLTATQEFDRQREERMAAAGQPLPVQVPFPDGPDAAGTSDPEPEEAPAPPSPQGDLFSMAQRPALPPEPASTRPDPELSRRVEGSAGPSPTLPASSAPLAQIPVDESELPLEVEGPPLQTFLEQLSLVGDADGETGVGKGRVSLMTLHAAKGLEFDAVFLTGMEEEIFPHRRATSLEASEEDMAEERRLCYVGFTRARRRLFCSCAQQRTLFGELKFNAPSRFLSEVPQALFGFVEIPQPMQAPSARYPTHRRGGRDDGEGPQVDRTYDQSTDFHQSSPDGEVKGMRVQHSQFGRGVVLSVSGSGPGAKLTIKFDNFGTKTVIARYLTPG
jgi:superfamily I DNA/RNA helicase